MLVIVLSVLLIWSSHAPACWVYDITINGSVTFSRSPAAPPFSHRAQIVVRNPITSAAQTTNGENPLDLGFFTLPPANPFLGVAGALYFATNTALSEAVIGTSAQGSAIDLVFAEWHPDTRTLSVAIDDTKARLGVLNIFNATSGLTAQIHNVLAGTVELRFSESFENVSGVILLGGSSGFGGPFVSSEYQAEFNGVFLQRCQ